MQTLELMFSRLKYQPKVTEKGLMRTSVLAFNDKTGNNTAFKFCCTCQTQAAMKAIQISRLTIFKQPARCCSDALHELLPIRATTALLFCPCFSSCWKALATAQTSCNSLSS